MMDFVLAILQIQVAFLPIENAKMQNQNWNDLRYVLAVGRGRTVAGAARLLGVDGTTVARRLAVVQKLVGARLIDRVGDGTLQLTAAGERAALHAERMEGEIASLRAALSGSDDAVYGTVRVTSVPIVINHVLVPATQILLKQHPYLQLELVADARDLSLTRREADIALRLARPMTGGGKIIARRIGTLRYAVYASALLSARAASKLPWITYDETMGHVPQANWIAAVAAGNGERIAAVRVNDAEGLLEAVGAGLGRSLLPRAVADGDVRVRRLGTKRGPPVLTRELWLLTHAELRSLARIEAVVKWIDQIAPK